MWQESVVPRLGLRTAQRINTCFGVLAPVPGLTDVSNFLPFMFQSSMHVISYRLLDTILPGTCWDLVDLDVTTTEHVVLGG